MNDVDKLKKMCSPIIELLRKNYDPYTAILITEHQIHVVTDEIGIPVKNEKPFRGAVLIRWPTGYAIIDANAFAKMPQTKLKKLTGSLKVYKPNN